MSAFSDETEVDRLRDSVAALTAERDRLLAVRNKRTISAIMRICPKCGDDMCGENHDECYKCERDRLAARVRELEVVQKTSCAICGEFKHTPLRNDVLGGYVCLTCVDKALITAQH